MLFLARNRKWKWGGLCRALAFAVLAMPAAAGAGDRAQAVNQDRGIIEVELPDGTILEVEADTPEAAAAAARNYMRKNGLLQPAPGTKPAAGSWRDAPIIEFAPQPDPGAVSDPSPEYPWARYRRLGDLGARFLCEDINGHSLEMAKGGRDSSEEGFPGRKLLVTVKKGSFEVEDIGGLTPGAIETAGIVNFSNRDRWATAVTSQRAVTRMFTLYFPFNPKERFIAEPDHPIETRIYLGITENQTSMLLGYPQLRSFFASCSPIP